MEMIPDEAGETGSSSPNDSCLLKTGSCAGGNNSDSAADFCEEGEEEDGEDADEAEGDVM